MYVRCADDASAGVLRNYTDLLQTLCSASGVHVTSAAALEGAPPEGCAISTVSARCEVHMMLKVGCVCVWACVCVCVCEDACVCV